MNAFRSAALGVMLMCASGLGLAQFKGQAEREALSSGGLITQPPSTLFFGWFDPSKFSMHHSFSLSYQTAGGQGMTLGSYTNSMMYQFTDNLDVQTDISMMYSPYSSFGMKGTKDLSGIYLSRAQLNYRPWENVSVQLQYRQLPYGYYYYSPFTYPWYRENGF
jgi:hypothetical protein